VRGSKALPVGFEIGGHAWLGHADKVRAEIVHLPMTANLR
jgi:riboflavin synthase alpha subunit